MDENPINGRIDQAWPAVLPEKLALFLAYWRGLPRPLGPIPPRRLVDPLDIPLQLWPGLGLIEALPQSPGGKLRYRYRLLGTDHYAANGRENGGRIFDELHPAAELAVIEPLYARLLGAGEPHYWRRPSANPERRHNGYARIIAPLADDQGRGAYLFGYWLWENLRSGV